MSLEDGADAAGRARLRAVAHPVRLDLLSLLTGAELSAAEAARELGITQANASYHLRVLRAAGLVEVAGRERVNGGLAVRYRHPWDAPEPAGPADPGAMLAQVQTMADAIPRRFAHRRRSTPGVFCDADLWVAPEVWEQVCRLVGEASRLVHANARPPRTTDTVRGNLSIAAFRMSTTPEESR
ncbi:MAG TPA: helix-turn-helix domain-containing protein [Dermatophilaceae bacterium]|nr:helix-turn-helix domain-containing protein [Dermatophilaceae bacterium]